MARQTSKGICTFCHSEFSKSAMTRHLETCEQKAITEAKADSRQKAQQTRKLHLVVEGRDLPMCWMHLEVTASATLTTLDQFLRNTPPLILCNVCGKPATEVCAQCIYDGEGWLCDDCAVEHEGGEEMLLPVVNSSRVGMCAYTG
jgi:hypothetical protein